MAKLSSHRIRAANLDLHWLEAGEGPVVLFVHGWPTSAELWRKILPVVGQTHRAIALDLPGFGGSEKPLDQRYGFTFFESAIDGFLAEIGVDRLSLVVHDLGGPVGLYWACRHRERVEALALLNTLVFPVPSWAVVAFVAASYTPGLRRWLASPAGVAASMRLGVVNREVITDEVARLYTDPFTEWAAGKALLRTAQGLGPGGFRFITQTMPAFADIPVRMIYGENDRILPDVAKTMAKLGGLLPQAEITAIPNCGHFLQEDQPDQVARLLSEFLIAATGAGN
ncbi:Alpha/beta hydrolase fold protein [Enhygromyxa salina]|uniref:Alpha/beta hydrolase fold protein n=1 Tax=Enhygromyxa salina TaxID=215803 RepID=A0A0C1ZKJ6_9BACT|nr:alpha/beta fold hydrolase [Enhygromyxa salina]KIG18039.1 Alpha/beta hydrolase fold protein [Enhygromyxa salina]